MDDQSTQSELVAEAPVQTSEPVPAPSEQESSQPNGSTPTDLPPEAPESPINAPDPIPVESQNGVVNQSESKPVESLKESEMAESSPVVSVQSVPVPSTLVAPQPQSPAQQDQTGFIRALLTKANAKLHSNRQKKLDTLMQFASKKGKITNDEAQKLLRISDKTAERYLGKLVLQGKLQRFGSTRDAFYGLPR